LRTCQASRTKWLSFRRASSALTIESGGRRVGNRLGSSAGEFEESVERDELLIVELSQIQ